MKPTVIEGMDSAKSDHILDCSKLFTEPKQVDIETGSILMATEGMKDSSENSPLLLKSKLNCGKAPRCLGILLTLVSGAIFTLCSSLVKFHTAANPMELLIIRAIFQILVTLLISLREGHNLLGPKGLRFLLLCQGVLGGTTPLLLLYSVRLLPLGDAATIVFSSPVFVMIISNFWLRESCGFYRTFIVIFLVSGVALIAKPPFPFSGQGPEEEEAPEETDTYTVIGYCCALSATLFYATNIAVMKKCKSDHFSVVVLQFSVWSLIISTAIPFIGNRGAIPEVPHQTTMEWTLIALVAVFGLSGQVLAIIVLAHEGAGRVAVTRSMDIVLAYVVQVLIFHEVPDWSSMIGAAMIIICVVGIGVEDLIQKPPN